MSASVELVQFVERLGGIVKPISTRPPLAEAAAARAASMTATNNEPTKHHLVPRFYLERWAVDGQIRVLDLERGRNAYDTSPERAAKRANFYRLDVTEEGESPVFWEAWLSEVEDRAKAAFLRIDAAQDQLSDEEHQWLCLFLAVQMTRSRSTRLRRRLSIIEQMRQMLEIAGPDILARELRGSGQALDGMSPELLEGALRAFADDPDSYPISRTEDLEMSASLAEFGAKVLTTRTMVIVRTGRATFTCDEPVVELHPNMAARQPNHGGVWGAPILVFPFGQHLLLLMYRKDLEPPIRPGEQLTASETLEILSVILGNAYALAISSKGDRVAEKLFLPEQAPGVQSERFEIPGKGTVFSIGYLHRWDKQPDAPQWPGGRIWPALIPPAPVPTDEEASIMERWNKL